jgi:Uma2 family endonuclease
MDPAAKLATYEDLLSLSEDVRAEILDGILVYPPAPLPRHSRAQRGLARFIGGPFDDDDGRGGPGGWWILLEVDIRLAEHDIVRPDIAGWRRERLPAPWDTRPIEVVPDWICEVLSPTNAATDRVKKRRLYAARGVAFYWIVDPENRTLEAFRLVDKTWVEVGAFDDTAIARIAPFEAIELEVARLFPPAAPLASGAKPPK